MPHLRSKQHALRDPCPDAENLCALAEGRVTGPERDAIAAHVNECRECSELYVRLLEFARPPVPVPGGEWAGAEKRLGNWMELYLRAQERRMPLPVAAAKAAPSPRSWNWAGLSRFEWAAGVTATIALTATAVTFLFLGSPFKDAVMTAFRRPAQVGLPKAASTPEQSPVALNPPPPTEMANKLGDAAPPVPPSSKPAAPHAAGTTVPSPEAPPAEPVVPRAKSADGARKLPAVAAGAPTSGPNISAAVLLPEVKQSIAGVVQAELAAEMQAAANSQLAAVPGDNSAPAALDPRYRVFIVSRIVSAQASDGQECGLTPGDVLTRITDIPEANLNVQVFVTTSQAGECGSGTKLTMSLQELQDMHNDFRERLESGLRELAENQGEHGMPRGPAASAHANPDGVATPDKNAAIELQQQQIEADNTEDEVARAAEGVAPSAFHPNRPLPADSANLRLAAWDGNIWQSNSHPQQAPPPHAPAPSRPAPPPPARPANPQPAPHPSAPPRPAPTTKGAPATPVPNRPSVPNKSGATAPGAKPSPSHAPAGTRPGAAPKAASPGTPYHATGNSRFTPPRDARATPDGRGGLTYRSSKGEFHTAPNGRLSSLKTPNGTEAKFNSRGGLASIHTATGMTIHHGANGARRIETLRSDGTKVVSAGRNRGFVENTFSHYQRTFVARTYVGKAGTYARVYGRYSYHGEYFYHYVPAYFYAPAFYGWAYNPWAAPVAWGWGWGAALWYGYYGYYFSPAAYYPSATLWLTDFLLAANLQAAYDAQASSSNSLIPGDSSAGNEFHAIVPAFDIGEFLSMTYVWNCSRLHVLAFEIA